MKLSKYSLDCTACTKKELQRFVKARGMSGKKRSRQQMIDALRNADLNSTFPFLDLPPEIRNMIYGHVLEGDGVGFEVRYELLRRVHTIKVKINIQSAIQPGSGLFVPEGRDVQVNHALNGLYTFLNGECNAKRLEVEVFSDLTSPERRVRRAISPICGLAGRLETTTFKFTDLSTPVVEELEGASAHYRTLLGLEDDMKLACEINRRVHHFSAFDLELYAQCLHPQFDFQYDQLHIWRDSGTMEEVIQEVDDAMEQAVNEDTEDLSGEMADAVKLLKENQRRRKMAAKQNNSNQK